MTRPPIVQALVLFVAAWTALSCGGPAPVPQGPIEPSELASRVADGTAPVVLDVRSLGEFDAGHIPGAIHVPHDEVTQRLPELGLPLNAEIVVLCEVGGRAATAEATLRDAGYTHVRDLTGHMQAWRAASYPME